MKQAGAYLSACLLVAAGMARGQTSTGSQAEIIQRLLVRIDQLEKRVAQLEAQRTAPPGTAPPTVPDAPPAPPAPEDIHAAHLPTVAEAAAYPALRIAGFTDFTFAASDLRGTRNGFSEGQFILHLASALSPRVSFFGEISMTARPDAGLGMPAATGFNVEVERSIIRFDQSDRLKLSFGRYHTPVNYWNTAFHHGAWLQTTISRPEMTQFGGSIIPVHFVGSLVEGAIPAGGLHLNYNFGLGNGRSAVISRAGDFGDINNHKSWLANLFVRPARPYGLQAGASIYRDRVSPVRGPETREWIRSAHVVWTKETPEIIAEYANVSHRPAGSGRDFRSDAWYVQAAYRLPWARQWKPYYRFEYIHVPASDPIFRGVSNLAGSVAGVRFDASAFAAFKFEYRNQRRPGLPRINWGLFQTAFTF
jgi:hypothetical protein